MRRVRRANRLARGLAVAGTATALLAVLASGGCELAVSDGIPPFTCLPGAADNCPPDSVCVPSTRQCVARSGTCTPNASTGCATGMRCDAQTLRCAASPEASAGDASGASDSTAGPVGDSASDAQGLPLADASFPLDASGDAADTNVADVRTDAPSTCRGITCSCSRPSDCDSGICADQLTATTALSMAIMGMNFCTQPCCTSTDCPGTTVCFGTGGGGSYCVAPKWIGRVGDLGTGGGGAMCTGTADCRSGVCANGACADTCCSSSTAQQSSECAAGTVCRFAAFPGNSFDTHETAWCGAMVGNGSGGSPCAVDGSCQSGKCAITRCEAVCRSTSDCSAGQACSYGLGPTTLPSNKDIVAGCLTATGMAPNGSACTSNGDCQSDFCDGTHCTDVCVTDADCKSGLHCRPEIVQVQGSYAVLCCES